MTDLGKAFTFPFKDNAWFSKFLLGGLFIILCILIVGIFIIAGYLVRVTQRVMRREENPMPDWDDIGGKLVLGFKYCVVYLIYSIPIILLYIPIVVLAILGEGAESDDAMGVFAGVYAIGMMVLLIPYALCITILFPVITYRFALHESIAEALDVSEIFRAFKRNWQNTVIVALIGVGIRSFAAVGLILFLVGVLFTIFYSYLVSAHMFGALYLEDKPVGEPAT